MKTRDDDYEDGLDLSEAAFKKRFRRIKEEDLPEPVRKLRAAAKRGLKRRVTIYFDSDVVGRFKALAEAEGIGYQTLMNRALRTMVDEIDRDRSTDDLKEDLLRDKKFIKKLKTVLSS
jgi:uncharacterized protein (DUF4415 family)